MARLRVLAGLAMIAALGGCQRAEVFPPLSFGPPIAMNVAVVRVQPAYVSPGGPPNVEKAFPHPPLEAAIGLINQRYKAAGTDGTLTATILDASVIEAPGDAPVTGTSSQRVTYIARVQIRLDASGNNGLSAGTADITVERTTELPFGTSEAERLKDWNDLTIGLMHDVDVGLEAAVRKNMAAFVM